MSIDRDYKKLMLWLAAAFIATIVAAVIIVELVMRHYPDP
jgi:hypothetical protein